MIVAVTGGRDYNPSPSELAALLEILQRRGAVELRHGDAPGVDRACADVAEQAGIKVTPWPADWMTYGGRAGPIRNARMLDGFRGYNFRGPRVDLLVAFRGNDGTRDCVRKAVERGIKVVHVYRNSTYPLDAE
jgi:hypothetical protein